jgi:hypothetical protein
MWRTLACSGELQFAGVALCGKPPDCRLKSTAARISKIAHNGTNGLCALKFNSRTTARAACAL